MFVLLAAASCGMPNRVRSMFGGQLPIQVTISPNANEDSALAVEMIVAYDEKVVDELLKMPARKWFDGREQFLRDHPEKIDTWKWEWTPGQTVAPLELSYGIGAKRVVLFADYLTPGEHRATIDPQQPFRLVLGQSELELEAVR
jgi:type VI secretion system protein